MPRPQTIQRIKKLAEKVIRALSPLAGRAMSPLVSVMAHTGIGTDDCLKLKCLPLPVNYYSPVPDLNELARRGVWTRRSDMAGIDFRVDEQLAFMTRLGRDFGLECEWPAHPTRDPQRFYTENGTFCYGCAAAAHSIIRWFKPRRLIEVGSGNSSLVLAGALEKNRWDAGQEPADYTIIDPYPRDIIKNGLSEVTRVIDRPVEAVSPEIFDRLDENDVLFIDSGHTVRIGGDVNFLILDVLPRLKPGVVVHFHDIPLPLEYAEVYARNPSFRVFWTESYLLQAFLSGNNQYEVVLAMCYLMTDHAQAFRDAFLPYDPGVNLNTSGSFWIRRKKG